MSATASPPAPTAPPAIAQRAAPAVSRRAQTVKWLRKFHGWIGLWGAILGLLFGSSGILLNHRTLLKLDLVQAQENTIEMPLPVPAPQDAEAMARWLQQALAVKAPASRVRQDKPKKVQWGDAALKQPARWSASFVTPASSLQAEYWVGNQFVTVKRSENNLFGVMTNLHKGTGMGVGWILLVDTLAGSIILLSLSGVLLWSLTARARTVGIAIGTVSVLTLAGMIAAAL